MKPLISVIVPAYNVEPYIEKCVKSIINQDYPNLEIILVNDGSKDKTGELCDKLKETDDRIQVIHQNNRGLSAARNSGLDLAHGEWIAFLDSDDWIEPEMYSTLIKIAVKEDAEIASCKTRDCYLNQEPYIPNDSDELIVLNPEQMIRGLKDQSIVRFEVWNKIWKKSLIGDIRFKEGQVSEDVYFDRVLFLRANKMVHIEKTLHNYLIQRPGNTLSSFKKERFCIFEEFDALVSDLISIGLNDTADVVNCIATSFAITIYGQAVATKQNDEVLVKSKGSFEKYYRLTRLSRNRSFKGNVGVEIFHFSPRVYFFLWKGLFGTR